MYKRQQLQLLQEYVIQPATYPLCLTAKNFSNTHSLTEAIAQHGAICDLNRLKPWEKKDVMMAWVHSYVMQHKISITLDDIKYIAAAVDFDIRALISELHKMMSFVTTSTITRKQIDQILAAKHKNSLSEFTDMLLAFNVKQAYCIVDNLIDQGINITTCFFHVRAQLRIGIQMHQSLNPKKFLSQTYPGFSSSFIDKKLELFSSYGLNKLHQGVQECVALESLARRMNLSDRVVLELLIAKLV